MTVADIIRRHEALSPNTEIQEWRSGRLEDIDSAILFVLATWSGQSMAAFRKLTQHLGTRSSTPPVLVCDVDQMTADLTVALGSLRGFGETFWILNGQIVGRVLDYTGTAWESVVDANNALLRERGR